MPDADGQLQIPPPAEPVSAPPRPHRRARTGGLLWSMRVRKKVLVLHTVFSLGLAAVLLVPLRPAIIEVVEQAEISEARMVLRLALASAQAQTPGAAPTAQQLSAAAPDAQFTIGAAQDLGLNAATESLARSNPGKPVPAYLGGHEASAAAYLPPATPGVDGRFVSALVKIPEARHAVTRLYILTAVALLAVYALVAAALELFVLPQHVYGPIGRMLEADRAVQEGNKDEEIIPDAVIPADELGAIMRSRNNSILAIRRHEQAVAQAVGELESVATDLKRKNHLLEAARRNLADADRLASLGMMSAGIAHELNTPLAVVKGLVEKLNSSPDKSLSPTEAALMLRVVRRLERLGDSLLDFARVRPPQTAPVLVRTIVDEALTLVRLDRQTGDVDLLNEVPESLLAECDGDRMVQVLVNLLRNGVDAIRSARRQPPLPFPRTDEDAATPAPRPRIVIRADASLRDGHEWVSITITDNGPGIDPDTLSRLFEPFVSTRLDAHGTGLGLAVAEGIVREHGGLILARNNSANRTDTPGATFEIMLPRTARPHDPARGESVAEYAPEVTIPAAPATAHT